MDLKDKNIILCVSGGIAAYKAAGLASFLKKQGANVYAVMTKNALEFIKPLTFKTVTGNKVTTNMFDESDFVPHISLADLADLIIVAPATANIIAKAAHGIADDMVSTLLLSSNAKKIIVPSMNSKMYLNPITQKNIKLLKENDYFIMEPDIGLLACGYEGIGKFPDIEKIYGFLLQILSGKKSYFTGKKILITLGGTIEDIDPVRYISNRSSGKMGFNLAEEFIARGGNVTLLIGNISELLLSSFKSKYPKTKIINVRSSNDLYDKVIGFENDFDIYCMVAAVADYMPDYKADKIKNKNGIELKLSATKDILASLKKRKNALYIGFAAETENLTKNAKEKLKNKNLDFIIANIVKGEKNAIGNDNAEVVILNKYNEEEFRIDYNDKKFIAQNIIDYIEKLGKFI
ncbi:MAG: bifunctional phosphopantothenoylcysteine decarboxylase/phosphopantothenate--cysteine ligase CoaBC [Spirochaetes bacterium]|nr:bifunctional phosphopantothenoylcysteine decarboxylase/phosphopantothenate--cysteine ligase CoaBC [Spirochaetota bacterium]